MPSVTVALTGVLGVTAVGVLAGAVSDLPPIAAIGGGIVLLASVVTALAALGKRLWHAVRGILTVYRLGHEAFTTIVGTDTTPGVGEALEGLRTAVAAAAGEARTAASEATRIGRITEHLDDKVEAQSVRITDHRRRQDETIAALREYLSGERDDLLLAKQGLEASVSELLMLAQEDQRHD